MRCVLILYFLFLIQDGFSQTFTNQSRSINTGDESLPSSAKQLSFRLTNGLTNEKDKVRAIYLWITDHISYRVGSRITGRLNHYSGKKINPATFSMNTLDEQVAEIVLRDREAVCDGYSRLFKVLCNYAGIQSELVSGYARGYSARRVNSFRSNHTWNAVRIDSTWYLLDVTWASGYINYRNEFIKALDDQYYLVSPSQFIHDHYPDDLKWSFVNEPPTLKEFHNTPFKSQGFIISKIDSYYPTKGIIEACLGETITIELKTNLTARSAFKTTTIDSMRLTNRSVALTSPKISGQKLVYTYKVDSPQMEWLHIFFNEQEIMRYRMAIKKN